VLVAVAAACMLLPASASAARLWTGAAPTTEPMTAQRASAIDAFVARSLAEAGGNPPGLWLGIWDPRHGRHVAAYGQAVVSGAAARVADHGRMGSITKTFTATGILRQVDAGRLRLGDTIGEVLPGLARRHPAVGPITVRELLGMRSGIPDYANTGLVLRRVARHPRRVWTAAEIIDLTLRKEPLTARGAFGYSTTNFLILGQLLARLTGEPIDRAVTDVARAAGLRRTALTPPADNAMPRPYSHGYIDRPGVRELAGLGVRVRRGDVTDWSGSWAGSGGAMFTTIDELGRWAATGFGSAQLRPATVRRRRSGPEIAGLGVYGLGLIDFGRGWVGHSGQVLGWEADAYYNTRTGAVAVTIVNEMSSIAVGRAAIAHALPGLAFVAPAAR
jgi:D-alanyl-D-alanine carboxypeptidase